MALVLESLIPLFFSFFIGINFPRLRTGISTKIINPSINICLFTLLYLMGLSIGKVPNILDKIIVLGLNAVILAFSTSFFIVLFIFIFKKLIRIPDNQKINTPKKSKKGIQIFEYIKDPLLLCSCVLLGCSTSFYDLLPLFDHDRIVTLLLCFMIFLIGIKLAMTKISFRHIFLQKTSLIIAFLTVIASLIGAAIASLFLDISLKNALSLSSGFGWYSLSGVLFSKLNEPVLASTAFLCDLFREILALFLLPILSKVNRSHEAIGISGATAMDVALPLIEKHCGNEYVPLALICGVIMSVLVPIFIPLFYYF
ncbi:lysine exporter LysO family protein [Fluviispira multicolorata]|uniref:DUF340 domain-containing protein n=1 Tax=Fluviispira multicolorata TaxID=2654512 RepID=A0A833JFZ0_9BACT|nr:lysine exporter LysO family protein [Fluviispira multicolorata]KAB8033663.1 DUF340 domain-containing protein [Fluviispira multicolorata]